MLSSKVEIDKNRGYSAKETAVLLEVTEETVKKYCRTGKLKGKRVGAKMRWHVRGSEIVALREKWGLDDFKD